MRQPKIVFIGAGSMSFGIPTFRDIFGEKRLAGATLCLVDIDADNLERMYGLALRMNAVSGLGLTIEKTAERRDALPGADFVINSLAIERCELWKQDFEVPRKHGIRHCLGENGGPGALYFTMRTLPLLLDIARDMEALCPNAWLLNFSNPETRIVLGVSKYTSIKCIGLCHGIFMARDQIAQMIGRERGDIEVMAAGMNHFQWVWDVRDRATGEDLYPLLREKEPAYDSAFMPYVRKMFHTFGLYPTCSDDHLGEYQAYGWEAGEHGYDFEWDERDRMRMRADIAAVTGGGKDARGWLTPSGEKAVEVLCAIHFHQRAYIPAAIVYNQGVMPQLPGDIAVEVPVMADGAGIHKIMPPPLPDGIIGLLNNQVSAQRLSVLAAAEGSKELALQALLCDPAVNSAEAARAVNEELYALNRAYIRKSV